MTRATSSVARLTGPAELAAAVPYLCGYVPDEHLVVLALRGPRGRLGLTQACPLPPADAAAEVAGQALQRVRAVGAGVACVLLYTAAPGLRPRPDLVAGVRQGARTWDVDLRDLLLVRDGRCWSQLCDDPVCCPPEGRAVPDRASGLSLPQAQSAAQGRAVLASRTALVESLAPPSAEVAVTSLRALEEGQSRLAAEVEAGGLGALRPRLLAALRDGLQRAARPPLALTVDEAALLVLALHDARVRDETLTWLLRREEALLTLLLDLAGRTPAPYDAPVCACVAWAACARGDGGLANVALDRALASDPGHALAGLLRTALDGLVPPSQVRRLLLDARRALRR